MAKGGTQVDMATLPEFAETKIQQGLNMGADVAGTGYTLLWTRCCGVIS